MQIDYVDSTPKLELEPEGIKTIPYTLNKLIEDFHSVKSSLKREFTILKRNDED